MLNPLVLKKYSNRRLYDTEKSVYVTLDEVAEIVKDGREIKVLEAKTHEDVTAFILTQIVLEQARTRNLLLPVPVLHLIIRYGNNLLGDFFNQHMQSILQIYVDQKQTFEHNFQKWIDMGTGFSEMAQRTISGMSPFQDLFRYSKPESKKDQT